MAGWSWLGESYLFHKELLIGGRSRRGWGVAGGGDAGAGEAGRPVAMRARAMK
jgi:hypothetical protein